MKRIPILGLALFAVFAFGAMTAASALAANGEWLVSRAEVKENLPAETEGLLFLLQHISPTNPAVLTKFDCEAIFAGRIGSAGAGTVTELLNIAKERILSLGELALSCTVSETHSSLEDCEEGSGNLKSGHIIFPGLPSS